MPVKFRQAIDSDFEYFWELNRSCYRDVVTKQFGEWSDASQRAAFQSKWLEQKFDLIFVRGTPVGGYWVDEHDEYLQLRELQIHPDHQGNGLGTKVIEKVCHRARVAGKPLRLRVLFRSDAVRLYERLGFQHVGETEHQYIMEHGV